MTVPVSDIDFYSDAVIQDPFPVYAELRDLGPVVYLMAHDLYLVARYKEVSEVLLQPLRFVSSRGGVAHSEGERYPCRIDPEL